MTNKPSDRWDRIESYQSWHYMSEWEMHVEPDIWPRRGGHRFIVAAYEEILNLMFGLGGEDLFDDERPLYAGGYRDAVVGLFADALMIGSLTAMVQPATGEDELRPMFASEWTPNGAGMALAKGSVPRKVRRKVVDHWVFIPDAQIELMRFVLSKTDMLTEDQDRDSLDTLGAKIFENIAAIAHREDPGPFRQAEAIIEVLLPSIKPAYDYDDRRRLVRAAAAWLQQRFREHPRRRRAFFEAALLEQFGKYVCGRMFDDIWRAAVNDERYPEFRRFGAAGRPTLEESG